MRSFDRVALALSGNVPDRVPILTFTPSQRGNMSDGLKRFLQENADNQFEFLPSEFSYQRFPGVGIDIRREEQILKDGWTEVSYTNAVGGFFMESYRESDRGYYRSVRKYVVDDIMDLERIIDLPYLPPGRNEAFIGEIEEFSRQVPEHNSENELGIFVLHDPVALLAANTDPMKIALWVREERSTVDTFLNSMCERQLEYLSYIFEHYDFEAVFMIGGSEYAVPPLMAPEDFIEFVVTYDSRICGEIRRNGKLVLIHCHGKIRDFISYFIEMGGNGIHPLEPVGSTGDCDLEEIKDRYGSRICLVGNIQYEDFDNPSEENMVRAVQTAMRAAKKDGGFMLAPACPFYHRKLPEHFERNLRAFVTAGLEDGKY